jgi:hypothetical protein
MIDAQAILAARGIGGLPQQVGTSRVLKPAGMKRLAEQRVYVYPAARGSEESDRAWLVMATHLPTSEDAIKLGTALRRDLIARSKVHYSDPILHKRRLFVAWAAGVTEVPKSREKPKPRRVNIGGGRTLPGEQLKDSDWAIVASKWAGRGKWSLTHAPSGMSAGRFTKAKAKSFALAFTSAVPRATQLSPEDIATLGSILS